MREQLFINGKEIPLSRSLDPSFVSSIVDINDPSKRTATYSKTTTVPHSKEVAKVFGNIFEINIENNIFNPNVKADCLYFVDSLTMISGYCQLKDILLTNNKDIEYSIVIYSEFANFFQDIKGKYLTELNGLDTYDHILNKEIQNLSTNQEGTWQIIEDGALVAGEYGKGYTYPLVDYGFSSDAITFAVPQIGCSIYAKEYWDRIFIDAEFTYEFTDSIFAEHFKHLIIPSSPEAFTLDSADIADREFAANTPLFTSTGTTTSNNVSKVAYTAEDPIKYSIEIVDDGGVYDPATGIFTCTAAGTYNFATIIDVLGIFKPTDTASSLSSVGFLDFKARIIFYDASALTSYIVAEDRMFIRHLDYAVGDRSSEVSPTYPDEDYYAIVGLAAVPRNVNPPNRMLLTVNDFVLAVGDTIKIVWVAQYKTDFTNYFRTISGVFSGGNAQIKIEVGAFYNKVVNNIGIEGNLFRVEKAIPKVLQTDFINNFIKEYNLYFDVDENDPKHFLIAPRDSFYTSNVVDLRGKVSIDKGINYEPMGALDAKTYIYKHKDDSDYLNTKYKNKWQKTYGQRNVFVTNEFTDKINTTEVSSSPTPLADNGTGNNRVLPTIIQIDELKQKISTASNWRVLYYAGQKPNLFPWYHKSLVFASEYYSTYPYAGHFDDPFNPTLDINFGLVQEVYYDDIVEPITVTDNNLYNKYYSKMIREITDKNSKIVTCYVNLSPADYKTWKFSDLFYFDNAYFRLNKINGYNPTNNELTKCEFLKLKEASPFKGTVFVVDGAGTTFEPATTDGSTTTSVNQAENVPYKGISQTVKQNENNFNSSSGTISGVNNLVSRTSSQISISGDNNSIMANTVGVNLINSSNNYIGAGLENITLINTDNQTINESNVTYLDGVRLQQPSTSIETVTNTISTISPNVRTYRYDTSAASITATFNITTVIYTIGQIWTFKKEHASNTVTINGSVGVTIDGATSKSLTVVDSYINIQYIGGTEFIVI